MVKFANSSQKEDEPVLEHINNWRNLSLNYKDTFCQKLLQLRYASNDCIGVSTKYFKKSNQIFFATEVAHLHKCVIQSSKSKLDLSIANKYTNKQIIHNKNKINLRYDKEVTFHIPNYSKQI